METSPLGCYDNGSCVYGSFEQHTIEKYTKNYKTSKERNMGILEEEEERDTYMNLVPKDL